MTKPYFTRKNKQFVLNKELLTDKAKSTEIQNALYAAVYIEFRGAATNRKYKNLNPIQRIDKLNEFAEEWLVQRGLT